MAEADIASVAAGIHGTLELERCAAQASNRGWGVELKMTLRRTRAVIELSEGSVWQLNLDASVRCRHGEVSYIR